MSHPGTITVRAFSVAATQAWNAASPGCFVDRLISAGTDNLPVFKIISCYVTRHGDIVRWSCSSNCDSATLIKFIYNNNNNNNNAVSADSVVMTFPLLSWCSSFLPFPCVHKNLRSRNALTIFCYLAPYMPLLHFNHFLKPTPSELRLDKCWIIILKIRRREHETGYPATDNDSGDFRTLRS